MTTASEQLRGLAQHIASANVAHMHPVAALLTGSAALGTADFYSDIDLIVYHDDVPLDAALERARFDVGATHFRWLIPRTEHGVAEAYRLAGVECQVAHMTAAIWVQHTLVETAFAVLGVLAGLNRRYYSAFQFKHMHAFVDSLALKPPDLAERLGALVGGDQPMAIAHAEALVHETLDLLARHLPDVDIPSLGHPPGERHQPWR